MCFLINFNLPRTRVTSPRYKFFNQSLSKSKFPSNLKFNLDNSKTLSTDSQLLQTDEKHLKSSFKLQIINEISFSYLFSKLGSSSSNQHFKSQNCLKTLSILHWCQLTHASILVPTTTTQTPLGTTVSLDTSVENAHRKLPSIQYHQLQQLQF